MPEISKRGPLQGAKLLKNKLDHPHRKEINLFRFAGFFPEGVIEINAVLETLYSPEREEKIYRDRPKLEKLLNKKLVVEKNEVYLNGKRMLKVRWVPLPR